MMGSGEGGGDEVHRAVLVVVMRYLANKANKEYMKQRTATPTF